MCEISADFSTITGSDASVREVERIWRMLEYVERFRLAVPQRVDLSSLDDSLGSPDAPAVAVLKHTHVDAHGIARHLQAELTGRGLSVIVEPGYRFSLASQPVGQTAAAPVVAIDPQIATMASVAGLPPRRGRRVAVLDTGHLGSPKATMVDLLHGQAIEVPPDDVHGHGTAVAQLIAAINPAADVSAVRIVAANLTTSAELLCGLVYAMWSKKFDVVNVSLSAHLPGGCATMLGTSLDMVLQVCKQGGATIPYLIAAAGNTTTGHQFGYPAQLPDAVVVLAWDWANQPALYNVGIPGSIQAVYATGGDVTQHFGTITRAGQSQRLYGTSFAAAVATAHLTL